MEVGSLTGVGVEEVDGNFGGSEESRFNGRLMEGSLSVRVEGGVGGREGREGRPERCIGRRGAVRARFRRLFRSPDIKEADQSTYQMRTPRKKVSG